MPTRDIVTEEMCEAFIKFLKESYRDFLKYKCDSTLRNLICTLYETAIVVFTFKYNNGKTANYKDVRDNLPLRNDDNITLVSLRDDLTHNLQKVNSVKERVITRLEKYTKQNFNFVVETCLGEPTTMYDDIIIYCNEVSVYTFEGIKF